MFAAVSVASLILLLGFATYIFFSRKKKQKPTKFSLRHNFEKTPRLYTSYTSLSEIKQDALGAISRYSGEDTPVWCAVCKYWGGAREVTIKETPGKVDITINILDDEGEGQCKSKKSPKSGSIVHFTDECEEGELIDALNSD